MKLLIPPPIVAALCGLAMWSLDEALPELHFTFPFQPVLACSLIAAGIVIDLVSIAAFRRARTTVTPLSPEKASKLVVGGLYNFTRNPMYLGMVVLLSGVAVWLGSAAGFAIIVIFAAYITRFQIIPEEERLEAIFGDQFRSYRQRVRRWI
ncbi:methyltransferase family protein [Aurantiacibacter marinus]|uniref:Isoprenylcysteine carboxyl methyltransferase n=1 Tax=Aurantiacibacter marinus TaxID=874156 RepID=A0A0H0XLN9_9SPHN|nr:isoprenylcysteine carboxylmethyltransferase family protein [Aurantiacibacter marinus]KLI62906.1 isoprenylcysteine carboxyl methyltransferase [Aurantiacibacter marinus]